MAQSQILQNYSLECEAGVNAQINLELYASYVYLSMSAHFDRDDVSLSGFSSFFLKQSYDEREHAERLMKFQNLRGGRVLLREIQPPEEEWDSGLAAMEAALALEKRENQAVLDLHGLAQTHNDKQMCDFLETNYLTNQVEQIKQFGDYITNLKLAGPGLGEYLFDKMTLGGEITCKSQHSDYAH